jgi:hypothetical protein
MPAEPLSTHSRPSGDPSIGRNINGDDQPLLRQRVMNGALSRSCGKVEKKYDLSTTITASMTPVPVWTSALKITTTHSWK